MTVINTNSAMSCLAGTTFCYICGLSTETIEYSCPSVCVSVCVCLFVYTITKKIMVKFNWIWNILWYMKIAQTSSTFINCCRKVVRHGICHTRWHCHTKAVGLSVTMLIECDLSVICYHSDLLWKSCKLLKIWVLYIEICDSVMWPW